MLQVGSASAVTETVRDAMLKAEGSGANDSIQTEPSTALRQPEELSADALQQVVLQSGVVETVLQAVETAGIRPASGAFHT